MTEGYELPAVTERGARRRLVRGLAAELSPPEPKRHHGRPSNAERAAEAEAERAADDELRERAWCEVVAEFGLTP